VTFALAEDMSWAPRGHVVAWEQFELDLNVPPAKPVIVSTMPRLTLIDDKTKIHLKGSEFTATFSKVLGTLTGYRFQGKELLAGPLVPNFVRHTTDNDHGAKWVKQMEPWAEATAKRTVKSFKVRPVSSRQVNVDVEFDLPMGRTTFTTRYQVYGQGDIQVEAILEPRASGDQTLKIQSQMQKNMPGDRERSRSRSSKKQALPYLTRIGMQLEMPNDFDQMTWLGRGPQENYWDRSGGYAVGLYQGKVADLAFDYIRPQECANRSDVRWAAWVDSDGTGLLAMADPLLNVSAWPYRMQDIQRDTVRHPHEIPASDVMTVNLDLVQMGVGGRNSWGAWTDDPYLLPADRVYKYQYRLRPYTTKMGELGSVVR